MRRTRSVCCARATSGQAWSPTDVFIASGLLRDRRGNSTLDLDSWIGVGWRVNKCEFVNKPSRQFVNRPGFP